MKSPNSVKINGFDHIPYHLDTFSEEELIVKSKSFYEWLDKRRSVRDFSDKKVPKEVIENIIKSASTAPSGAHKQPWTFCAISNAELKTQIRKEAEIEEKESYESRMSERWKKDLAPLGTDMNKPFFDIDSDSTISRINRRRNYCHTFPACGSREVVGVSFRVRSCLSLFLCLA